MDLNVKHKTYLKKSTFSVSRTRERDFRLDNNNKY